MLGKLVGLIPLPWRIGAAVVVAIAALSAAWWYGHNAGAAEAGRALADYRASVSNAAAKQAAQTVETQSRQSKITQETDDAWHQNLNALHAYYDGRLRQRAAANGGRAVPGVSSPAGGADAAAADARSGSAASAPDAVDHLERAAAVTTQQLLWLQDWARRQADIRPMPDPARERETPLNINRQAEESAQ